MYTCEYIHKKINFDTNSMPEAFVCKDLHNLARISIRMGSGPNIEGLGRTCSINKFKVSSGNPEMLQSIQGKLQLLYE